VRSVLTRTPLGAGYCPFGPSADAGGVGGSSPCSAASMYDP